MRKNRGDELRAAREVLVWWGLLLVLDVIFISSVTPLELMVGAAAAALGAVGARAVRRASDARWGGLARGVLAVWSWPWALFADTGRLFAFVVRKGRAGTLRTVELSDGVGPAWACALLSATPGTYAVDVTPAGREGRLVTVHSLFGSRTGLERVLTGSGAP
ncbi:hypothetical protein ACH4VR_37360 [Streptomyces sp. NPDC020883]|uniref:hypothetical protein n=1 Tax=unclassified Streptomyces TaxID=2593676 RepID=UPI0034E27795